MLTQYPGNACNMYAILKKLLHYAQSEKKRDVVMLVNNYLAFDNPTEGI